MQDCVVHAQTFFSFLLAGESGAFLCARSASACDGENRKYKRIKRSSVVCFALLPALSTYEEVSDSKAVALAVELEAATRFILSSPKWLAYR